MGYANPKVIPKQFTCAYCVGGITNHLEDSAYDSYLCQLSLLRRLIRYSFMTSANESKQVTVGELEKALGLPLKEVKNAIFCLHEMDYGTFEKNGTTLSSFRLQDITRGMKVQLDRSRNGMEVIKTVYSQEIMLYSYFKRYSTPSKLWKSFNQFQQTAPMEE